ncbi:MAG: nuclear transport factor 2 family protein, partial [Bacteroidota bacterium]
MNFIKNLLLLALFLAGLLSTPVASAQQNDAELAAIRTTLMHYIEGTSNGEPDRIKKAFHPD